MEQGDQLSDSCAPIVIETHVKPNRDRLQAFPMGGDEVFHTGWVRFFLGYGIR